MDYEISNATRWEEPERKPPVRVNNKKKRKKKKKSTAGSVAGSVTGSITRSVAGSVQGQVSRPVTPDPYASSSAPGGVHLQSQAESDWAAPSELDDPTPEEPEAVSPWGKDSRRHRKPSYNFDADPLATGGESSDPYHDGYEPDSEEAFNHSIYNTPNYYWGEDPALEYDAYDGPDGLLRENYGDRAERAGESAAAKFDLPVRRHPDFDVRFFGPDRINLRHIAGKTDTHLEMPLDMDEPSILMWGKPAQIAIARRELLGLMEHLFREFDRRKQIKATKRKDPKDAWNKVKAAPSDRKQRRIEEQIRDQAKRKRLRHLPPKEPFEFNAVGSFIWPSNGARPQNVLGPALEALDDVRYECEVYVLFLRDKGIIQVLGDDPGGVQKAVDRVFGTFCEAAARNRRPREMFLFYTPSVDISIRLSSVHDLGGRHITLRPDPMTLQATIHRDTPPKRPLKIWKVKREKLERANSSYLKQVVQQGLNDVLYFRGHATLKIQFGTLVFFGHPGSSPPGGVFTSEKFGEMLRDPHNGPTGELIRFIGEEHAAKALINECLRRKDLFQPVETSNFAFDNDAFSDEIKKRPDNDYTTPHSLTPEPALEATINLKMYDGKCTHDIRLEIEFVRVPGRHPGEPTNERGELYKAGARKWLYVRGTINNGPKGPKSRCKGPLDVKVLDSENDLAWQIELTTYPLCKDADIYPIFTEFVRRLRIEDIPDESDPIPPPIGAEPDRRRRVQRVSYANLPGMVVENVIMKTKYQYWLRRTCFLFEVTRYEWFPTDEVNDLWADSVSVSWRGVKTNHDTRWGASLFHQDWVNALSKQTMIGIGCAGGWDPDVNAFFQSSGIGGFDHPESTRNQGVEAPDPWQGDGWKELMARIHECASLIAKTRKDSLEFAKPGYSGPEEFDE